MSIKVPPKTIVILPKQFRKKVWENEKELNKQLKNVPA